MSSITPPSPAAPSAHGPFSETLRGGPGGARLPHLGVVQAQGPEAGLFLQGQLTQDVVSMSTTEARAGGYCSAKGRLLANFVIVHPDEQTWWLVTHAGLVESLVKRLKMFVLRAKCTVATREDLTVCALQDVGAAPWTVARRGAGSPEHDGTQGTSWTVGWWGRRALRIQSAPATTPPGSDTTPLVDAAALETWRHADVAAGWPWIEPATVEQFVPQMINFELLGGVNFRKGCYPGQEVVARSQYRGTLKRRMGLFLLDLPGGSGLPAAGAELFHSDDATQPAGMVVNAAADPADALRILLLAEVKIAAQAAGTLHLLAPDGPPLRPCTLPYPIPTESEM